MIKNSNELFREFSNRIDEQIKKTIPTYDPLQYEYYFNKDNLSKVIENQYLIETLSIYNEYIKGFKFDDNWSNTATKEIIYEKPNAKNLFAHLEKLSYSLTKTNELGENERYLEFFKYTRKYVSEDCKKIHTELFNEMESVYKSMKNELVNPYVHIDGLSSKYCEKIMIPLNKRIDIKISEKYAMKIINQLPFNLTLFKETVIMYKTDPKKYDNKNIEENVNKVCNNHKAVLTTIERINGSLVEELKKLKEGLVDNALKIADFSVKKPTKYYSHEGNSIHEKSQTDYLKLDSIDLGLLDSTQIIKFTDSSHISPLLKPNEKLNIRTYVEPKKVANARKIKTDTGPNFKKGKDETSLLIDEKVKGSISTFMTIKEEASSPNSLFDTPLDNFSKINDKSLTQNKHQTTETKAEEEKFIEIKEKITPNEFILEQPPENEEQVNKNDIGALLPYLQKLLESEKIHCNTTDYYTLRSLKLDGDEAQLNAKTMIEFFQNDIDHFPQDYIENGTADYELDNSHNLHLDDSA